MKILAISNKYHKKLIKNPQPKIKVNMYEFFG